MVSRVPTSVINVMHQPTRRDSRYEVPDATAPLQSTKVDLIRNLQFDQFPMHGPRCSASLLVHVDLHFSYLKLGSSK